MIDKNGISRFRHAESAQVYEIHADEIEFEVIRTQERRMGLETEYSAEVDHQELGLIRWTLWEYPVGIVNFRKTDHDSHELLENINFDLRDEQPASSDDR